MIISLVKNGQTLVPLHQYEGKQVKVSEMKSTRSNLQNNYLWAGVYPLIAEHTGYTTEEVHEVMKYECLPRKEITVGERTISVPKSTKKLNTKEFTEYVERVAVEASKLGIVIPPPTYTD